MNQIVRKEAPLWVGLILLALAWIVGLPETKRPGVVHGIAFILLFATILMLSFRAIHHADSLGKHFGQPYDTLILTLSILSIELSLIAAIMFTGDPDPTLARDTMFAGLMLTLNGVVGVVLIAGGLKFGQQEFNLEGARAYLAALTPLAVIALVVPKFTGAGTGTLNAAQAIGISIIVVSFYLVFIAVQTSRHRGFFTQATASTAQHSLPGVDDELAGSEDPPPSAITHWALLIAVLIVIAMLAREISAVVDYGIHRSGLPAAVGGILIASITLLPESVSAYRAALRDKLQHSINVFLGSSLATIGLTVPCVLILSLATNHSLVLGLKGSDMVLLLLTLFVSALTFGGVRTNVFQGAAHLLLFALYVLLVFAP